MIPMDRASATLALLAFYIAISLVTFMVYACDKAAARQGRRRISEKTLHLLGLAGGWPGALLAQKLLRHKSRKASFQVVLWLTVALHCGVVGCFAWLLINL